jgi:hypothetical protein
MKGIALADFCTLTRFSDLGQVDALKNLNAHEKTFCKDRLRILNPSLK